MSEGKINHVVTLAYQHEARTLRLYVDAALVYERNGVDMGQNWSVEYPNIFALASGGNHSMSDADRITELEHELRGQRGRAETLQTNIDALRWEHAAAMAVVRPVAGYQGVQDDEYFYWACGFCGGCSANDAPDGKDITHTSECPVAKARAVVASIEA